MEILDITADSTSFAESIRQNKLSQNTVKQYQYKYNQYIKWIETAHSDLSPTSAPSASVLNEFFGYICKKRNRNGEIVGVLQTYEHVSGYRSALKYYFKENKITLDEQSNIIIESFLGGYERTIASKKQKGEISIAEGKQPLTFAGYRLLANDALKATDNFDFAIFARLFLLLCWNLIARCHSVSSILWDHITWVDDSLVIVLPTTKSDQEGRNAAPKHIYANPNSPEICPVLWLAVYLFTIGYRRQGASRVIFGGCYTSILDRLTAVLLKMRFIYAVQAQFHSLRSLHVISALVALAGYSTHSSFS